MSGQVTPGTPLPWQVVRRNASSYVYQRGADIMSVLSVAEAKSGKPLSVDGRAIAEANARYIVTACNAFPELLEQLSLCADELRRAAGSLAKAGEHEAAKAIDQREERARAIVAKARGEQS